MSTPAVQARVIPLLKVEVAPLNSAENLLFIIVQSLVITAELDMNIYYAGQRKHGAASKTDGELYWIEVAGEKFRGWANRLLPKERKLFLSVGSREELEKLVESGLVSDPLGWFD